MHYLLLHLFLNLLLIVLVIGVQNVHGLKIEGTDSPHEGLL
jgi:hypothetical protein